MREAESGWKKSRKAVRISVTYKTLHIVIAAFYQTVEFSNSLSMSKWSLASPSGDEICQSWIKGPGGACRRNIYIGHNHWLFH
jgi:hypothetical protein